MGGSILLQHPLQLLLARGPGFWNAGRRRSTEWQQRVLARFLATLLASWFSLSLLNSRREPATRVAKPHDPEQADPSDVGSRMLPDDDKQLTGKTIDLTLFAATRAIDVIVGELWARHKSRRIATGHWTRVESLMGSMTDAGVFAISAGMVMWAWFYHVDRLPHAYRKWIGEAAEVDQRLLTALQRARRGEFVYGKDTGQALLLQSMCRDYGWPLEWGDPAMTTPLPCEMVHMGVGPSCELHAGSRFLRAFKFAMATYLPLNLLLRARSPSVKAFQQATQGAVRSSAFLATFISLFYYSICLSRTRVGPLVFSRDRVSAQAWDSGIDVGAGCLTCGWSILIEAEKRRQEVAFFVAPRAAATLFPRRFDQKVRQQRCFVVSC